MKQSIQIASESLVDAHNMGMCGDGCTVLVALIKAWLVCSIKRNYLCSYLEPLQFRVMIRQALNVQFN